MTGNTKTTATAIQQGIGPECNLVPLEKADSHDLLDYELIGIRAPAIQLCHPFLITSVMRRIGHGPRLCPKLSHDLHGLE